MNKSLNEIAEALTNGDVIRANGKSYDVEDGKNQAVIRV